MIGRVERLSNGSSFSPSSKSGHVLSTQPRMMRRADDLVDGADGEPDAQRQGLEAFRAASLLHKIGTHDFELWISADEAFRMATLGGARSTGLQNEIGSLETGKRADVILLDRDAWGFIPLNDPIRQLAFSVTSESVTTSIIDGRVVMRGRTIALLDEASLKAEVAEAAEHFRRGRPRSYRLCRWSPSRTSRYRDR